jgi:hypothetical protein
MRPILVIRATVVQITLGGSISNKLIDHSRKKFIKKKRRLAEQTVASLSTSKL